MGQYSEDNREPVSERHRGRVFIYVVITALGLVGLWALFWFLVVRISRWLRQDAWPGLEGFTAGLSVPQAIVIGCLFVALALWLRR